MGIIKKFIDKIIIKELKYEQKEEKRIEELLKKKNIIKKED